MPRVLLTDPITALPGVGDKRGELLRNLGIATIRDLLFRFPRDYQDRRGGGEGPGGAVAASAVTGGGALA